MRKTAPLWLLALALPSSAATFETAVEARSFAKGQLHSHTLESDGDLDPPGVAARYAALGFQFLAVTDHDKLTQVPTPPLTMIPGVEITSHGGKGSVHMNALCGASAVKGAHLATAREALEDGVTRGRADGALVLVNHPNWGGGLTLQDLLAADGYDMLEIASGHPTVHDDGDAGHPPAETLWQELLDRGRRVYAAAVDDAHDYVQEGEGRRPGQAWVEAWGFDGSGESACAALREGRFYASTGALLRELRVEGDTIRVEAEGSGAKVEFLGQGGKLLKRASSPAEYRLKGGETYVRARVRVMGGKRAWTQAYWVRN